MDAIPIGPDAAIAPTVGVRFIAPVGMGTRFILGSCGRMESMAPAVMACSVAVATNHSGPVSGAHAQCEEMPAAE